jgi:hypothetical protein
MVRMHPFLVGATALFVGVTALGASAISERRARRLRPPAPPPVEPEAPLPAPRQHVFEPPRRRAEPPPPAPTPQLATLRVRVTGPHGVLISDADVWATPRGASEDDEGLALSEDEATGGFVAMALEPGRYDLHVQAVGFRDARLSNVPTGEEVVDVSLSRSPVLLGAVGGGHCEGLAVSVTGPATEDGEEQTIAVVDPESCRFEIDSLPETGPLTVVAGGRGWTERALVTLPAEGDPRPVCLRAPCEATPASLAVYVVDATGRLAQDVSLDWSRKTELEGELGSTTLEGFSLLHGRVAGQMLKLHASSGAGTADANVHVGAGVTEVVLTLPASVVPDDDHGGGGEDAVVRVVRGEGHRHHADEEAEVPILVH